GQERIFRPERKRISLNSAKRCFQAVRLVKKYRSIV
ncbi:unnamed protein product, partial [Haemonchus placei]|uniref:MADS-box domain-containing protein n=1 Tax=Haemonchus placei TaxID=6290 RepID=A0A0N4W898_HAEPC